MGELIFNAGLFIFFLAMTIYSGTIEIWQGFVGARYWPMVALVATDIIFAFKTVSIYKALPAEQRDFKPVLSSFKDSSIKRLLASFLILIVYAGIVEYLGFFISTVLLGMAISFLIGLRHIGKLITISLAMTLGIYLIFVWGLDIMLPRGAGPIYYFGYWLELLL